MKLQTKESLTKDFIQSKEFIHWKTDAFPNFIIQLSKKNLLLELGSGDYSGMFIEHVILMELLKRLPKNENGKNYFFITLQHNGRLLFVKRKLIKDLTGIDIATDSDITSNLYLLFEEVIDRAETQIKRKAYKQLLTDMKVTHKELSFTTFSENCDVICNGMAEYNYKELERMIKKNPGKYETLKAAGYKYIKKLGDGTHLLKNLDTGKNEIFGASKNHLGWGVIYKNTQLEFMREAKNENE